MRRTLALAFFTTSFLAILFGAPDQEQRKVKIQQLETEVPSQEAVERKARSIAFLKTQGVPTLDTLPMIGDSASSKIRSPKTIAERLIACTISAVGGETGDKAFVTQLISEFGAENLLTPGEKLFVTQKISSQQERVQFSWRYERSWVLLWALGYVERLDYPPSICDVSKLAGLIHGKSVTQIIREAKPRSAREILDEADLIYRLNWAVVDERANKKIKVPEKVEKGVVEERHAALNWLIGYMNQEWDDISTDT